MNYKLCIRVLPLPVLLLGSGAAQGRFPGEESKAPVSGASLPSALVEAYRADVADVPGPGGPTPVFLGLEEGGILAAHLDVTATVAAPLEPARTHEGQPVIQVRATLRGPTPGPASPWLLLFGGRHWRLLERAPEGEARFQLRTEAGGHLGYREAALPVGPGREERRPVPADGHCLLACLHAIRHGHLPEREAIGALRRHVAERLAPDQVETALRDMREDILAHPGERFLEGGSFQGYGPRASQALLELDAEFRTRREAALARLKAEQAPASEEGDEAAQLELALQLSLGKSPVASAEAWIAAFREDLALADSPFTLGPRLAARVAQILAGTGQPIGFALGRQIPGLRRGGRPVFVEDPPINPRAMEMDEPFCLVWREGSFQLLKMMGEEGEVPGAEFYRLEDAEAPDQGEVVPCVAYRPGASRMEDRPNALIHGIHFLKCKKFASAHTVRSVRMILSRQLTNREVRDCLTDLREDLLFLPLKAARAWEGPGFPGAGPRISALLAQDRDFLGRWKAKGGAPKP